MAVDPLHNNRLLYKNKILDSKNDECKIAYGDHCIISRKSEIKGEISIKNNESFGVRQYLTQFRSIYNSPESLAILQKYVQNVYLLVCTKDKNAREALKNELNNDIVIQEWAKNVICHGLVYIWPPHLRCYTALLSGIQTFDQCINSNLIDYKCKDSNNMEHNVKCSYIKAPSSSVEYLALHFQLGYLMRLIDKHGFQSVTEFKGEYEGLKLLSSSFKKKKHKIYYCV